MRELDLHGNTWKEALEEFEAECKRALERSGGKPANIRVIHGYGAQGEGGVIRDRLRAFCGRYDDCLEYTRGEDIDGNRGMTETRVLQPPPVALERLGERVLEYCRNGRTMSEVEGRFRHSGASMVKDAVAMLRKQRRLDKPRNKRGRVVYVERGLGCDHTS